MSLRIRADEKALYPRVVALRNTDLTDFVVRHAVRAAQQAVEEAERVRLTERDSIRVLDLLENPPAPNARLVAARSGIARAAMMGLAWHEEPIGKHHDRTGFDCGEEALNEFLRRYARKSHERGGAKTFLAIGDSLDKAVLGFYSLSPASVEFALYP